MKPTNKQSRADGLPVCDAGMAASYLDNELSDADMASFEDHVSGCSVCQERLESHAALAGEWQQVAQFLTDDESDLLCLSALSDRSDDSNSLPESDLGASQMAVRQAMELLDASDDPQMLGRIGSYEVCGLIGSGGMGIVFKAFDRSLNRFVAIKMLAPHLATIGSARRRFARESQAAAAVVHDNVIEIYGVSEDHDPPFLVMPYVRGMSLQKRLTQHGALQLVEILRVAVQTSAGLAAAHAQGLVHRDIKPANILLLDGVERVRITDFGLARAADDASLTRSGVIAGTPQYMSPEQARGDAVDHRSDLFSLGSVIYTMCTGHAPFRAETSYGVLRRITDTAPRPIREVNPDIPEWLCQIVETLQSKTPQDRFQSADEVYALLSECLSHVQTPHHPLPGDLGRPVASSASVQRRVTIAVCVAVALSVVCWLWVTQSPGVPAPVANDITSEATDQQGNTPDVTPPTASVAQQSTGPASISDAGELDWDDGLDNELSTLRRRLGSLDQLTDSDNGPPTD